MYTINEHQKGPLDTTIGKQIPLSSERLKTCELLAELLHLLYLYTSSPLFMKFAECARMPFESDTDSTHSTKEVLISVDRLIKRHNTPGKDVADSLLLIARQFVAQSIIPKCLVILIPKLTF